MRTALLFLLGLALLRRGLVGPSASTPPPGTGDPTTRGEVIRLARSKAAEYGIPPWTLLATAQVESYDLAHGPPYDDVGSLSFPPYGMKAATAAAARRLPWNPSTRADLERQLRGLPFVTDTAARLMRIYWHRYGGDTDLVRIAWNAGGGTANKVRDSGSLPAWYLGAKRDRWEAAVRRWGGSPDRRLA